MAKSKVFLDTNIVADMIDADRDNFQRAFELLKKLTLEDDEVYISEDMISTLYYISRDKKATLEFFEHIVYRDWHVLPYGLELIKEATKIALTQGNDLEDTLQCLCAKKAGCDVLVTEDQRFVECGVEIANYDKVSTNRDSISG